MAKGVDSVIQSTPHIVKSVDGGEFIIKLLNSNKHNILLCCFKLILAGIYIITSMLTGGSHPV